MGLLTPKPLLVGLEHVGTDRWGGLQWVDMLAGDVLSLGEDGAVRRRNVGGIAAALRPRSGGGADVSARLRVLRRQTSVG